MCVRTTHKVAKNELKKRDKIIVRAKVQGSSQLLPLPSTGPVDPVIKNATYEVLVFVFGVRTKIVTNNT